MVNANCRLFSIGNRLYETLPCQITSIEGDSWEIMQHFGLCSSVVEFHRCHVSTVLTSRIKILGYDTPFETSSKDVLPECGAQRRRDKNLHCLLEAVVTHIVRVALKGSTKLKGTVHDAVVALEGGAPGACMRFVQEGNQKLVGALPCIPGQAGCASPHRREKRGGAERQLGQRSGRARSSRGPLLFFHRWVHVCHKHWHYGNLWQAC